MMSPREFLSTPTGQLVLVGLLAVAAGGAVYWQQRRRPVAVPAPVASSPVAATAPRTIVRDVVPFQAPEELPVAVTADKVAEAALVEKKPVSLPLSLMPVRTGAEPKEEIVAPYGRLIPCETVLTLESNRLETPVIGLVTDDVWHDGRLVIPKGAEVHGRASADRARERLAAEGAWRIVWRSPGKDQGTEIAVQGIALDRERDEATGAWGLYDGSAGLRGQVLATNDWREAQLFAATFLSTATLALQDSRTSAGLLGESVTPVATVRNGALAGTSAVLREYARQIREAVDRDGIYVRVPAGKPFYLYVTQTLDRGRRGPTAHEN